MNENVTAIDTRISQSIQKLIQVQRVLLWDIVKKYNLSPLQTQFILFLSSHSSDLRRVSALADEFDLTRATVSDAVKSLEKKGIIKKTRTENDKRFFLLELTGKGKQISKKIDNWQKVIITCIKKISTRDKEIVYGFMVELIKSLFDNGVISTARMCLTCGNIVPGTAGRPNMCKVTQRSFYNNDVNFNCGSYAAKSKLEL